MLLRVQGSGNIPITPEPDDAEIAAAALLEMMSLKRKKQDVVKYKSDSHVEESDDEKVFLSDENTSVYYHKIANNIRDARAASRQRTMRFLSFCEQELQKEEIPLTGDDSLRLLETELYKRFDTIEMVGGELKKRWQSCMAEVTIRIMQKMPPVGEF